MTHMVHQYIEQLVFKGSRPSSPNVFLGITDTGPVVVVENENGKQGETKESRMKNGKERTGVVAEGAAEGEIGGGGGYPKHYSIQPLCSSSSSLRLFTRLLHLGKCCWCISLAWLADTETRSFFWVYAVHFSWAKRPMCHCVSGW